MLNTYKDGKNYSLKLYIKQPKRGLFISHPKICPLAAGKGKIALSVNWRNGHIYDRCASGRPPGRPAIAIGRLPGRPASTREWGALSRSTVRSIGRIGWPLCTSCAHRSTGRVDRLLVQSTARAIWLGFYRD